MTRVIYGKIGRATAFDSKRWSGLGGDNEPVTLLLELAARHPDVEFVFGSRYSLPKEHDLPANIVFPELPKVETRNKYIKGVRQYDASVRPWMRAEDALRPYYEEADSVILWAGQMGTTNFPVPRIEDRELLTDPQDSFMNYVGPVTANINRWRDADPLEREEVWLCPDPRNYLKAREVKWPPRHPILAQYDFSREQKHERYGDPRPPAAAGFEGTIESGVWLCPHEYTYDALEITGTPMWTVERDHRERVPFKMLVNETRGYVSVDRASVVRQWVQPIIDGDLALIRGKWTPKGAEAAGITGVEPIHFSDVPDFVGSACCTFTSPASGSRWATAKPHEAFRLGTVCFFHPMYDAQGHIIPTLDGLASGKISKSDPLHNLALWLRVSTPEELRQRVRAVSSDRLLYEYLRDAQLELELQFIEEKRAVKTIEKRVGLAPG